MKTPELEVWDGGVMYVHMHTLAFPSIMFAESRITKHLDDKRMTVFKKDGMHIVMFPSVDDAKEFHQKVVNGN